MSGMVKSNTLLCFTMAPSGERRSNLFYKFRTLNRQKIKRDIEEFNIFESFERLKLQN